MENIDLQVGDRVTYKRNDIVRMEIIRNNYDELELKWFEEHKKDIEILKIERPKYEVVEENKELLTQEEKEFLKDMLKYYEIMSIRFKNDDIVLYDKEDYIVASLDYPSKLKFEGIKKYSDYTLKELGLE